MAAVSYEQSRMIPRSDRPATADTQPQPIDPSRAEECRRQCELIAAADLTPSGREEADFWDQVTADAWDDLS